MVYVDTPIEYPQSMIAHKAQKHGAVWCHLWCDKGDDDRLHEIAKTIGLKREWYQKKTRFPHYDLVQSKRLKALAAGAVEMEFADWWRAQKKGEIK